MVGELDDRANANPNIAAGEGRRCEWGEEEGGSEPEEEELEGLGVEEEEGKKEEGKGDGEAEEEE